jgi:uncharacterized protein (TIGR02757 family)
MTKNLESFLNQWVEKFNTPQFIENDPISIPHQYSSLQDIEITAFWTAVLAWGQRKTIINKAKELFNRMDNAPFDFIKNHSEHDRKQFLSFKHRTFQATDTLYFLEFLQNFYKRNNSLETAFIVKTPISNDKYVEKALCNFYEQFFNLPDAPHRTRKHIATPQSKSTCKRLCMFLRWMVRRDDKGVDFGLWQQLRPAYLMIPLDVHVERHARNLGLLQRKQTDWNAVIELTETLRKYDSMDPVKYDFALFGLGISQKEIYF